MVVVPVVMFVLIVVTVRVVDATTPSVTATVAGLNEQTGAGSTSGVIELQPGVTFPVYPSVEAMFMTAVAPLPAGTVAGLSVVATAIVYSGDTASTVIGFSVTDAVCVPETPVTVTV